jgi:hypothetical protein
VARISGPCRVQRAVQSKDRVERLLNGVFERFAHSVQDVPARGGSGILKPHAETEKQAPGDCFAFAPKRLLVLRNDPRQLGVNVGIEIAGEVGGGLANGRQQLTDAGEVVALSVDFCGWREGDPEIGTESEMWAGALWRDRLGVRLRRKLGALLRLGLALRLGEKTFDFGVDILRAIIP